jgi:thioredoxin-like negative regulator of GroEL
MDKHLEQLAPLHQSTAFFKILVEDAPFLVEKLGVKVLPCVVCFVDGVSKDRLVGFEELGNKDSFASKALEFRLQSAGVLQVQEQSILGYPQAVGGSRLGVGADNDDDWD